MFEVRPLRDVVAKQMGGGTPSRQVAKYWNGHIPWASVKDFADDRNALLSTQESITESGLQSCASELVPAGTPLVCTRMAIGRSAMAPVPIAINQDVKALIPNVGTSAEYLLRLLQALKPRAEAIAVGSTVKGIRISDYLAVSVPIAPEAEQPWICKILFTLDAAIRQTEAIIEKLKQVKQGLLHDLLARGIDANGELRPPRSQEPSLYKESLLGWIPKEWQAFGLADVATPERPVLRTGPFGSSLKGEHFTESGRPVVTIGSLGVGRFLRDELLYVSEKTARSLAEFELIPGDIAFSRVADVGRSVVVGESERGWIMSSNFMRISVNSNRMEPKFLQAALSFDTRLKQQVRSMVNSAGRDVASSAILMGLRFPTPPAEEQRRIVARMQSVEQRIDSEAQYLEKLKLTRTGLSDDLLTGRVRVTPLLDPAPAA